MSSHLDTRRATRRSQVWCKDMEAAARVRGMDWQARTGYFYRRPIFIFPNVRIMLSMVLKAMPTSLLHRSRWTVRRRLN